MTSALMLVTNDDAPFYRQQVDALASIGIDSETVAVPGPPGSRSPGDYGRFYAAVLRSALDDHDLVHANYGLTAPAALAQPVRPVVLSLWGSDLFGRFGRLSEWCATRCDEVIVMTRDMASTLDRDCHVVPHGIDMTTFRPQPRRAARERVGWDEDALYVLFPYDPARPVKDFPRARRVVDAAAERVDGTVELAPVHGVPHGEVPWYVSAADVVLLTSRHEGSPNVVKEALACDRPVVATDVGDVAERVAGLEHSGVHADDEGLVDRLAATLAAAPVAEGRERVRGLGLESMARQLAAIYEAAGVEVAADTEVPAVEASEVTGHA